MICKHHGQLADCQIYISYRENGKLRYECFICRRERGKRTAIRMRSNPAYVEKRKMGQTLGRILLSDTYIKSQLQQKKGFKIEDIPPALIEFKRAMIILHREIKKRKSK